MKKLPSFIAIMLSLALVAGCSGQTAPTDMPVEPTASEVDQPTETEAPIAKEYPLSVNLTGHQHQPM